MEGDLAALLGEIQDGRFLCSEYPDALARIWSALKCPTAGDVLLSASPGYEFVDWGGADHVGGGSHGSPHRRVRNGRFATSLRWFASTLRSATATPGQEERANIG